MVTQDTRVEEQLEEQPLVVESMQEGNWPLGGLFSIVGCVGKLSIQTPQPTAEHLGIVDITDPVVSFINRVGLNLGVVLLYSKHTTCTVVINEKETLLMKDVANFMNRLAPRDGYYLHNQFDIRTENMNPDEFPNGHAHCQAWLLGNSQIIPIVNSGLTLGTWQRIFAVELDSARPREIIVMALGSASPREGPMSAGGERIG